MSYEYEQLEDRIKIIEQLETDPIEQEAKNHFVKALLTALTLTNKMDDEKARIYLAGINKALGSKQHISQWMKNTELFEQSCQRLQTFININYPLDDTSTSWLRWQALADIFFKASAMFLLVVGTAMVFFGMLLPAGLFIAPLFFGIGYASLFAGGLGLAFYTSLNENSYEDMIIHNEHSLSRTNRSLIDSFGVFACSSTSVNEEIIEQHPFPDPQPIYVDYRN